MNTPAASQNNRQTLLEQIAAITTMQPGTLAEEWREHPDPDGAGIRRVGPYYKHQLWRDGRNISRRVPATEAPQLREDIDNAKRYEQLTDELAALNFQHTLELRASESAGGESTESKKNSRSKLARNASRKPKLSSKKPKHG